ncbi:hypothetical protein CMO90_00080 [Candidatus Woesearchaeota archaeon]|nr:hypothetical protein [Candidatus Woesearchaeota archaeon]|tara:strand:+ start:1602 stop:2699 length:1098 start_codon:yes stop_codon:yes gene_type:complete
MKTEITSLELYYLLKELKPLVGGRIEKIYQKDKSFMFVIHVRGEGKKFLKVSFPGAIYLTEHREDYSELPGFCKFLRKRLMRTSIESIEQKGFERILEFKIQAKDELLVVIIELFSNGNLLVCDGNYKVISALESHKWKDRTIRGGIKYAYPPEQNNVLLLNEEDFCEIIKKSDKDSIVKSLAIDLNLGGLYAEELCLLAGVDKSKKNLSKKDIIKVFKKLKLLLSKMVCANIVGDEILPFNLKSLDSVGKKFSSFSEAIDSKLSKKIVEELETAKDTRKQETIDKVMAIIHQQEQTINGLKKSMKENQRKGELIYEHYEIVKKTLDSINKARDKFSWKEIKEELKGHKVVKKIDEKQGKITLEI